MFGDSVPFPAPRGGAKSDEQGRATSTWHTHGYADVVVRTLDLTPWAGRWVAVDSEGGVRCDAGSLAELLSAVADRDVHDVQVMRAPAPGEPVVYGLG